MTFDNILSYLLDSGAKLDAGHTMQVGDETFIRSSEPAAEDDFLKDDGPLFVVEVITADAINR